MAASRDKLVVTPLTARLWPTFVDLLDEGGPASRCWCMAPRIGASYRRQSPGQNRDAFQDIVEEGPPPGLLALEGKTAVGWCQLTPREVVPAVERSWRTRRVDGLPVWLISCFYVRKGHRRQGITAGYWGFLRRRGRGVVSALADGSGRNVGTHTATSGRCSRSLRTERLVHPHPR